MLSQNHTTRAEDACQDECQREPPHGIEAEKLSKDKQGSCHTANGGRVGRDLPPHINHRTGNLDEQGGCDDGHHKVWDMEKFHQINTEEVTEDTDNVGYDTSFFLSHVDEAPALMTTVEMNQYGREYHCQQINHGQQLELVTPWHLAHVAEHKQDD